MSDHSEIIVPLFGRAFPKNKAYIHLCDECGASWVSASAQPSCGHCGELVPPLLAEVKVLDPRGRGQCE